MYEGLQKKLREVLAEAMALASARMANALARGEEAKARKYQDALAVLEKLDIAVGISAKPIAATSALSAEEFGKISWALSLGDFENPQARKKGSFGVWVRQMAREGHLPEDHPGIELAGGAFGDALAKVGAEYEIKMFLGKDIPRTYEAMHGHLRSCMTSDGSLVELWALNPDKVALVVAFRGGRPLARALLWREVHGWDEDGERIVFSTLDRIYASEEGAREALKQWAWGNGYATRSHDDYYEFSSGRWFELPDGNRVVKAVVHLRRERDTLWPYADSFRYLVGYSGTDCYLCTHNEGAVGILELTDGDFTRLDDEEDDEEVSCQRCGDGVHPDDAYYPEDGYGPFCAECYHEHYTTCDICDREVAREDAYWVDHNTLCQDCYERYAHACDNCGEHFFAEDMRRVEEDGEERLLCRWCYRREVGVEG